MKLSSIELRADVNGIKSFRAHSLGDVVLLAGSNGSGKTRLLKIIEKRLADWNRDEFGNTDVLISVENDAPLTKKSEASQEFAIQTVNYSHFDAKLQTPDQFTPYVISKAKNLLTNHEYEETALNSFLYLTDMAKGYSKEFETGEIFDEFKTFAKKIFDIDINKTFDSFPAIFGRPLASSFLSPGQQYLLRMAISCFIHREDNADEPLIFLFDEPELHLHPKALLTLIDNLKETFSKSQFWISTHSLALIAHWSSLKSTTMLIMNNGTVTPFRSNSKSLLEGLIGSTDNRFELSKLIVTPSEYAINKFALECLCSPDVLSAIQRQHSDGTTLPENDSALIPDRQAELVNDVRGTILDFGAGQGRFLEELLYYWEYNEIRDANIDYYAYDIDSRFSEQCKIAMQNCKVDESHYYCGEEKYHHLMNNMHGMFDFVVLANVLHEIEPKYWEDVFKKISVALKDDGKLLILEKTELTDGETPFENGGFLILSKNDAQLLFDGQVVEKKGKSIVCFVVNKRGLSSIDADKIKACVKSIKNTSKQKISEIRDENKEVENERATFKNGIRLAFWTHQLANATIVLEPPEYETG